MTDDKTPDAGDLLGQGAPGRPAVGRGPNAGGEFSQEDYHHPSAGWGAARSVAKVLAQTPGAGCRPTCDPADEPRGRGLRLPGVRMAG